MAMVAGRTGTTHEGQTPDPKARDAAAQHAAAVASACEELVAAAVASAQAAARELTIELTTEGVAPPEATTTVEVGTAASPAATLPEGTDTIPRESAQSNSNRAAGSNPNSGATRAATSDAAVPSATKKDGSLAAVVALQEDVSSGRLPKLATGTSAPPEHVIAELCPREDTNVHTWQSCHTGDNSFRPDAAAAEPTKNQHPVRGIADVQLPRRSRWRMESLTPPRWPTSGCQSCRREAEQTRDQQVIADLPVHIECNPFQRLLPSWACCVQQALPWNGQLWPVDCRQECETMAEAEQISPVPCTEKLFPDPGVRHRPFSRQHGSIL